MYETEEYTTESGQAPFSDWLVGLRDQRAQARILGRLDRVRLGNLGDWKPLAGGNGLAELRDPFGPGCRIYFAIIERRVLVLLAGSTKADQRRTVRRAETYLAD